MRNSLKKYSFLFLPLMSLLLFLTACGVNSTSTGGSNQSNLTPLQVIQKSQTAMKGVKSYHLALNTTVDTKSSGSTAATPTATPGATTPAGNAHITSTGSGDVLSSGDQKLTLTSNLGGQTSKTTEIVSGDKLYIQNPTDQKWYYVDKNTAGDATGLTGSGFTLDQNSTLALLQNAKITDHGTQTLNGQSLRHLTATLDKAAFQKLLSQNPQLQKSYGQLLSQFANNTKTFTTTVDAWIDEKQFYIHRIELNMNIDADTKGLQGSSQQSNVPSSISLKLDNVTDLSNYNESVTITPPTDASPLPTNGGYPGGSPTPTTNSNS
jgi:hypothetical protein